MADVIRKLSNIIAFENQIQTCDAMIIIIFSTCQITESS